MRALTVTEVDDQDLLRYPNSSDGEVCAGHSQRPGRDGVIADEVACLQVSAQLSGGGGELFGGVEALDEAGVGVEGVSVLYPVARGENRGDRCRLGLSLLLLRQV